MNASKPTPPLGLVLALVVVGGFLIAGALARFGDRGEPKIQIADSAPTLSAAPGARKAAGEAPSGAPVDTVVLLHGLIRSSGSMSGLKEDLAADGYRVVNIDYPSTEKTIDELVTDLVDALATCCSDENTQSGQLHFVTHSLGGILVRELLTGADHRSSRPQNLGRVVMISPPNQGSELADLLHDNLIFQEVMGPAGQELVTDPETGPASLGPVDFDLGVITGDATVNPLTSSLIPGPDDGKVSVASAKIEGMRDFLVVPHSHTWITMSDDVSRQVRLFLKEGHFDHGDDKAETATETPPDSDAVT